MRNRFIHCKTAGPQVPVASAAWADMRTLADPIRRTCSSVDSRLTQSDEDDSIHGVVPGKSAVLAVESGRSGAIYLAQIVLDGPRMHWTLRDRIRNADGDIDLLAKDEWLQRLGNGTAANDTASHRCEFE